ncbi:RusA family crossover junction endodeoxyribonuclease [Enterobacter cloacae subsp. cloacae]|uniref:RusA family crossover junction endodeoxyribonuclease n=1 Tax=Enterobacter cloacae TaxID=550 RepID=UPI0021CF2660|nr:RusA family crossover junction endodeoxyribonuclease [Enterobacter cloacae]MCU6413382.1 RusA family crossover junction endodeoxyribonuclease [Enterobacter cloacae]MDR9973588.1 RusA family crossover junction endodeoxyribonuclease [Enterobacter cloacae subsp. cloacae]MDS0088355.1 RusA family crossover junction endodeoxyribonuclease [Enterobacter cloacae subsp. cloacae]HCL6099552.1 RusA family crossover junction endodeoxyribonuclease [Enterobacter cloacae]
MAVYNILPIGKPRMTHADKWKKCPEVMRYWAFYDHVRLLGICMPESNSYASFILLMPKSWNKKKRAELNGQHHQGKPDLDNLMECLMEALFEDDTHIWDSRVTKLWGENGQIIIRESE